MTSSCREQICRHFADGIFKCIFVNENSYILISLKFVPNGLIDNNGSAPNRRQAIIWTNADPIHWRIYASLGEDELRNFTPNTIISSQQDAFKKNAALKMLAILFRPQCVKMGVCFELSMTLCHILKPYLFYKFTTNAVLYLASIKWIQSIINNVIQNSPTDIFYEFITHMVLYLASMKSVLSISNDVIW